MPDALSPWSVLYVRDGCINTSGTFDSEAEAVEWARERLALGKVTEFYSPDQHVYLLKPNHGLQELLAEVLAGPDEAAAGGVFIARAENADARDYFEVCRAGVPGKLDDVYGDTGLYDVEACYDTLAEAKAHAAGLGERNPKVI